MYCKEEIYLLHNSLIQQDKCQTYMIILGAAINIFILFFSCANIYKYIFLKISSSENIFCKYIRILCFTYYCFTYYVLHINCLIALLLKAVNYTSMNNAKNVLKMLKICFKNAKFCIKFCIKTYALKKTEKKNFRSNQ